MRPTPRVRQPIPPARDAALACLQAVLEHGEDVQAALDRTLRTRELDPRDGRLCTELCYGYLRLKGRLDYLLHRRLRRPGELPPRIALLLGLAAYEILFLDRVPDYASVDWAVSAVRAESGEGFSRLANAVLRRVAERATALGELSAYRQDAADEAVVLARFYACPEWLVRLWTKHYGPEKTLCFLKASIAPPPLGIRLNRLHQRFAELSRTLSAHPGCIGRYDEAGLMFSPGSLEEADKLSAQGALSRQSLAAQAALDALEPEEWEAPIWDACAGRGGKTCLLLERGFGPVWASDINLDRLQGLGNELTRLGLTKIPLFACRADAPALGRRPRTILLDAPCSGLGVLSRRPDAKLRRTPASLRALAATQSAMLEQAWELLEPGGRLIYITCTLTPRENENQLNAFLERHPSEAELELTHATLPDTPYREFFWAASIIKA